MLVTGHTRAESYLWSHSQFDSNPNFHSWMLFRLQVRRLRVIGVHGKRHKVRVNACGWKPDQVPNSF